MDVYIARQPIFDRGENIYGYELLCQNNENKDNPEENRKETAAHVLYTAFFVMQFDELTGGTRGFLKFSEDLLTKDIPQSIPKDRVIIEVLNPIAITKEFIHACKTLRASNYILALDDFDPSHNDYSILDHFIKETGY
jgi:c-di-GMP-related signal transduction protein